MSIRDGLTLLHHIPLNTALCISKIRTMQRFYILLISSTIYVWPEN